MTALYAAATGMMGVGGAVLVIALTTQVREPLILTVVLWSLAGLLAALGMYSAWALLGGKM